MVNHPLIILFTQTGLVNAMNVHIVVVSDLQPDIFVHMHANSQIPFNTKIKY